VESVPGTDLHNYDSPCAYHPTSPPDTPTSTSHFHHTSTHEHGTAHIFNMLYICSGYDTSYKPIPLVHLFCGNPIQLLNHSGEVLN